ncbi:MAG: hypothetical protein ACFFA4_10890 [Promethearchaeota archaeon]
MGLERVNDEQLKKERLEKEQIEKEKFERERIEKQKLENKLYPNNSLFIIPSWSDLLGYPTLGNYAHHPVLKIISDPVIFFSGYDYSIETAQGTLHYLFGLGYYFLKFELESGKYITDNRILTGLVLPDFAYDLMVTSGDITLEDDHDVIISEKVIKIPLDLSNKSEDHLTFVKGALMRNLFIPYKDIFLEMMDKIRTEDSYIISKWGHMILSAHWDFFNQILVSDKMYVFSANHDFTYLNSTAGLDAINFAADKLLEETISSINLGIIEDNIVTLRSIYSAIEFDPMYLFSIIEQAALMLGSNIQPITSKQISSVSQKTSKKSIFASAEERNFEFISWPQLFKRKGKKEPIVLPKLVEQPTYAPQNNIQGNDIRSTKISDYKQEKFELETLKSQRVEFKPLPSPPIAEIKPILLYLIKVIQENYEMRSVGKAFEIARETMRQIGVSATTTEQKKIWEMSKYANIYLKKDHNLGLSLKEKQELIQKINKWLFEIEEEERKEKEERERVHLEKERVERLERERIAREKLEKEMQEKERLLRIQKEKEILKQEQLEKERLEKIEMEKQEKFRLERERIESERKEIQAIEKEQQELERLKQERKQKEKEAKQEAKKRKKLEKQKKKLEKKKQKEQERLKNL